LLASEFATSLPGNEVKTHSTPMTRIGRITADHIAANIRPIGVIRVP
jgi:hypothetical protein